MGKQIFSKDKGSSLVWPLAALVLVGFVSVSVLQSFSRGAVASYHARVHAEGVAVLSWKTSEARVGVLACQPPPLSIATINNLGPDELTPTDGFRVTCESTDACWPPNPDSTIPLPVPPCPNTHTQGFDINRLSLMGSGRQRTHFATNGD